MCYSQGAWRLRGACGGRRGSSPRRHDVLVLRSEFVRLRRHDVGVIYSITHNLCSVTLRWLAEEGAMTYIGVGDRKPIILCIYYTILDVPFLYIHEPVCSHACINRMSSILYFIQCMQYAYIYDEQTFMQEYTCIGALKMFLVVCEWRVINRRRILYHLNKRRQQFWWDFLSSVFKQKLHLKTKQY